MAASAHFVPPPNSLRALAAKVGLRIGTAANPDDLTNTAFSTITSGQFSVLTPENAMKWQSVEPQEGVFNWTDADNLVNYAEAHGQLVRGHTLVWHNQLPNWLTQGVAEQDASGGCSSGAAGCITDSQLMDLLHQHITTEVSRYRGRIWQWDVVNEMLTDSNPSQINPNDFWISHLGTGIIADAFRWAHAADPHALLCYNDYNIAGEDGSNAKFNAAFSMIKGMLAEGVPISCVGDQGHLDLQFGFNPIQMTQDLQQYASLGLKVAITEADVRTFVETADSNQNPIVGPTINVPNDTLVNLPGGGTQTLPAGSTFPAANASLTLNTATTVNVPGGSPVSLPAGATLPDAQASHPVTTAEASWYDEMLQSCLQVSQCISFTVWGFDDSESWVPGTFGGEGSADLYDVNLNPKPAYTALQQTLEMAAAGTQQH